LKQLSLAGHQTVKGQSIINFVCPQSGWLCGSWRIALFLAPKYELLQSNSRLLGCEMVMETRASFILAGFALSLPCSAPCATGQTTIDTGCDPALPRNCVDHPADCNLFKKHNLITFARIWPLTYCNKIS